MKGGYFLNAGVLYQVAQRAYERTLFADSERSGDQRDALIAILFSAATLEAFIVEFVLQSSKASAFLQPIGNMQKLELILDEVKSARGSVGLKYLLTRFLMTGKTYDKGKKPFQDFALLFRVRNAIVHLQPEKIKEDVHQLVKEFDTKKLSTLPNPNTAESWLSRIETRAVARWACNVVPDMIAPLRDAFPDAPASPLGQLSVRDITNIFFIGFGGVGDERQADSITPTPSSEEHEMTLLTEEQISSLMKQKFDAASDIGHDVSDPNVWFAQCALNYVSSLALHLTVVVSGVSRKYSPKVRQIILKDLTKVLGRPVTVKDIIAPLQRVGNVDDSVIEAIEQDIQSLTNTNGT